MNDTTIVWNIRGLGRSRSRLKKLVKKYGATLVAISEPFADENLMPQLSTFLDFPIYCCNENMEIVVLACRGRI